MENNIDFAVAMTSIIVSILFIVAFFGIAAMKDLLAKRRAETTLVYNKDMHDYVKFDAALSLQPITHSYSASVRPLSVDDFKFMMSPTIPRGSDIFIDGDYRYTNGLPVYNALATEYNRKNA